MSYILFLVYIIKNLNTFCSSLKEGIFQNNGSNDSITVTYRARHLPKEEEVRF